MSNAIAGHGVSIAFELDPAGTPGVFTTLGELVGDTSIGFTRPETEVTPHNEDIDSYVTGVLRRENWDLSVNYIYGSTDHEGIREHIFDNTKFGVRFLGPSSGATTGVDEVIASGFLVSFIESNPAREGERSAEIMFRPSGPMKVDGVIIGA